MDPIVKTESLKNKVVSLEDSVDVYIFLSLSVGAPSETLLRHYHFQVQQWAAVVSRLRGTSTRRAWS